MHHLSEWQILIESKRMDESWKIPLIGTFAGAFPLPLMYLFTLGRKKIHLISEAFFIFLLPFSTSRKYIYSLSTQVRKH